MVFIDDTPFEIQTVKNMLPDVMTILYNRDTVYEQLSCFNLKSDIDIENIQHRNNTFKSNQLRESLKCEFSDYNEYLKALEMRVVIKESSPVEYSRISELSQRTNKFTNGKRYTVADIKEKAAFGCYKLYSVSVSDKFSDLGLIGTIGIDCNTDGNILDLFCLSCRALGRNVENKMLQLVNEYKVKKFEFISTGKNSNIKTLFNDKIIIRQF